MESSALFADCLFSHLATGALVPAMMLSQMAGGGTFPCFHQSRRHLVDAADVATAALSSMSATLPCSRRQCWWLFAGINWTPAAG